VKVAEISLTGERATAAIVQSDFVALHMVLAGGPHPKRLSTTIFRAYSRLRRLAT
jgi:hypothetical protein